MNTCTVKDCDGKIRVKDKGLCNLHYDRWRKTGDPLGVLPSRWATYEKPTCKANGCKDQSFSLGYCRTHYIRFKKYNDPHAGHWPRKNGEGKKWHIVGNGYVVRYEPKNSNSGPNGQVYQHRHVMSKIIGRPLKKGENVHHKNGNRQDNSPSNLELWANRQPYGQRVCDVAQWAIEWLTSGNLETALTLHPELGYHVEKLRLHMKGHNNGTV